MLDTLSKFGAFLLTSAALLLIIALLAMYIVDKYQTSHTIRRNYPLLGRCRYFLEHLGVFFRQYFFAMDREEMPFNRAQRTWVYRAAKDIDSTIPFGSTLNASTLGTILFNNDFFPLLDDEARSVSPLVIGENCPTPYTAHSPFNISAMSYGALSKPAILALSQGAKLAQCWMNTGEGGVSEAHLQGGADLVFQIGTAKYGVRDENGQLSDKKLRDLAVMDNIKMFELKLSQGAKPGKGGILPAEKVTAEIAEARGIPEGEASISPNRHAEIDSLESLLETLNHIRKISGKPVGFKTVMGTSDWLDSLCHLINEKGKDCAPDFITLDSADGGTGAAPQSLMDHVGMPLEHSLPLLVDTLRKHQLKERIKVVASGKLITPHKATWALCMGADFVNSARGFMFALGCIQAMQCNKNTCPAGITTHDPDLQRGLVPKQKSKRVAAYAKNMVKEISVIAHSCGVAEPRLLRRKHASIVTEYGQTAALNNIYPE